MEGQAAGASVIATIADRTDSVLEAGRLPGHRRALSAWMITLAATVAACFSSRPSC
jgi:hypothetical protein